MIRTVYYIHGPTDATTNKKTANINVKNEVYKNGYRRRSCTYKTAKIHRFVKFVM